jgi:hypothetical protein
MTKNMMIGIIIMTIGIPLNFMLAVALFFLVCLSTAIECCEKMACFRSSNIMSEEVVIVGSFSGFMWYVSVRLFCLLFILLLLILILLLTIITQSAY